MLYTRAIEREKECARERYHADRAARHRSFHFKIFLNINYIFNFGLPKLYRTQFYMHFVFMLFLPDVSVVDVYDI